MVKKVREYKSGDFIFAKVKGYPAWPARVQRMNGKKYFVYFYGTGEIANLPPNMIFDYAENKDKFLTKTVKRRDFNNGVKQIEHDFANNVPLEEVIGINPEVAVDPAINDTANDSAVNETMDDTNVDTSVADESVIAESNTNTAQNDTAVEDSDENSALVIDEGKPKTGKKSKVEGKAPGKETPAKPVKEPKTPRGKSKKEDGRKEDEDEDKKEEEIISRSGRKIRPKRYMDEHVEDNATLPSPAPKKRRGASPASDKDKDIQKEKDKPEVKETEKNMKHFTAVTQTELEDLKEPFKTDDPEKDNILIAFLPSGQYVGVKLFQSRPTTFKSEVSRLQWDRQAATNAITIKLQLEKGHITSESVTTQLVMNLNLSDEEKATLDKEREMDDKKSRVQFLKTEMKLMELDAKIKTCLSLEKADTELCLKLLDELQELNVKPLMLLKHPTCLETVKRMRAYVGNTPSWDLSESAAIVFSKQAHRIRKQADTMYKNMKELFTTPDGLSFWEFFSERVLQFKKVTSKLTPDELLELVHEPLEMSVPTSYTMKTAVEAANEAKEQENEIPEEDEQAQKKKISSVKAKKPASNNTKTPIKRQSSRKLQEEKVKNNEAEVPNETESVSSEKEKIIIQKNNLRSELDKELKAAAEKMDIDEQPEREEEDNECDAASKEPEKVSEDNENSSKETENSSKQNEKSVKENDKISKENDKISKENDKVSKENDNISKDNGKPSKDSSDNSVKEVEDSKAEEIVEEKEKEKEMSEPRAKRTRESKKTEPPPPRSPAKRKAKC